MSDKSRIEWTEASWNPVTGCTKVSPGCDHCYAERVTERFGGKGSFEKITLHEDRLSMPLRWKRPRRIFVNSMSDLFHESVPDGFIAQVWDVMGRSPQHTFQILTKRHARMRSWVTRWAEHEEFGPPQVVRGPEATRAAHPSGRGQLFADMLDSMGTPPPGAAYPTFDWMKGQRWWPAVLPNVWLGVSVEDQKRADLRIPALLETPAVVRWLSCEPLLGPIDLSAWLGPIDWPPCWSEHSPTSECPRCIQPEWVVVGGESGPGARPMHPDWARSLRDQCQTAKVPFFFKQWGEWCHSEQMPEDTWRDLDAAINLGQQPHPEPHRVGKKNAGRILDGRTWDEYPAVGDAA